NKMDDKLKIRYVASVLVFCIVLFAGFTATASAQEPSVAAKPEKAEKNSGRDPFKKFEPAVRVKSALVKLEPPSIQVGIDRCSAEKLDGEHEQGATAKQTTRW